MFDAVKRAARPDLLTQSTRHGIKRMRQDIIMDRISSRGLMSTISGDRFALAVVGVLSVGIIWSISTRIVREMENNLIEPSNPKTQYITQETEDALPVETLDKLLDHPSYSIREVSLKILCDRAVNDKDTMTILLHGITQTEYDRRSEGLRAIGLLVGQSSGGYRPCAGS
jgi:hypothetical protein